MSNPTKRFRSLLVATIVSGGLLLGTASTAFADGTPPPTKSETPNGHVLCTYKNQTYSSGSIVQFEDGDYYECKSNGSWDFHHRDNKSLKGGKKDPKKGRRR